LYSQKFKGYNIDMYLSFITPLRLIIASTILLVGALTASLALAPSEGVEAGLSLSPHELTATLDTPIKLEVTISAQKPINAFMGEVVFDTNLFTVDHIEYNTELADLWVTEPWYSKADNTIYFAGGTTRAGGFLGKDNLLTIYLSSRNTGETVVGIKNARVLKHDGFGTDATLGTSIDTVISLLAQDEVEPADDKKDTETAVTILPSLPNYDINNDGKVSLADVASLMLKLGSSDLRFDFSGDGVVSTVDLSLILSADKADN
jgi:hypothetical protein